MLASLGRCLQSPTTHARIKVRRHHMHRTPRAVPTCVDAAPLVSHCVLFVVIGCAPTLLVAVRSPAAHTHLAHTQANALAYLQSMCGDGACANVLLATQLPAQLLGMLRVQPDPPHVALHVHAVTMLGLMVRHALVVPDDLAAAGLLGVLHQGLQGRAGDPLRRAYAATFGEVLFYVASQTGGPSAVWKLPERTIGTLCDVLLHSGDPVVQVVCGVVFGCGGLATQVVTRAARPPPPPPTQQYILKTVENIASQDGPWTAMLASEDMLATLCTLWVDADADEATHPPSPAAAAVQASAASALCRLLRWAPHAVPQAVRLLGLSTLLHGARVHPVCAA